MPVPEKLKEWYVRTSYHSYDPDQVLILQDSNNNGFGKRPVVVVAGFNVEQGAGVYTVQMYRDDSDLLGGGPGNCLGVATEPETHKYSKEELEMHFRPARTRSVAEAMLKYCLE